MIAREKADALPTNGRKLQRWPQWLKSNPLKHAALDLVDTSISDKASSASIKHLTLLLHCCFHNKYCPASDSRQRWDRWLCGCWIGRVQMLAGQQAQLHMRFGDSLEGPRGLMPPQSLQRTARRNTWLLKQLGLCFKTPGTSQATIAVLIHGSIQVMNFRHATLLAAACASNTLSQPIEPRSACNMYQHVNLCVVYSET